MKSEIIDELRDYLADAQELAYEINNRANTKHTALDCYCAFDCQHTVSGLVDRLVARHYEYLRFSPQFHSWFIYTRTTANNAATWQPITYNGIVNLINDTIDAMRDEIRLIQLTKSVGIFPNVSDETLKDIFRFHVDAATKLDDIERELKAVLVMSAKDAQSFLGQTASQLQASQAALKITRKRKPYVKG